jgi:hypothetical protein
VTVGGLLPGTPVIIGFGSLSAHELLGQVDVDAEGEASIEVEIPYWAELNRPHIFFWALADQRPRGFSDPFHVTAPDGTARVVGTIRAPEERTSCIPLQGPNDTRYMLQGVSGDWAPGTRVTVTGTVLDGPACSGAGLPIFVREIRPA